MIKIIKGNIFETAADIRINTVNCVGVMGAGVALAFKNKYPEMFRDYQKDCKTGKIKPGQLHIWKNLLEDWIINFPTKRHWREPSRYEDIEAGLKALRDYLIEQSKEHKNLRIALPALGCGHGGLDWKRVSQMIRKHLSDLEAEIFVFEPSASRLAGRKIENGEDEKSLEKLQSLSVTVITPDHEFYPKALRGRSAATFYAKGNLSILVSPFLAIFPSSKPSDREIDAATGCIESVAQPGVTFLVGYGPAIERPSIRIALQQGANVALFLSEGIINFRIRQDLQDIWDEDRIIVLTAAKPNQKWSPSLAFRARDLQLTLAKAVLITDPSPDWLSRLLKKRHPSQTPSIFYVNYSTDEFTTKSIYGNFRAFAIGKSVESGRPNVAPIIECLDIMRAPVSIETEMPVTETYANEAQIPQISGQVHEAPAEQVFAEKQRQPDGSPRYPKRLIEVDLPIKRISAHARREKSIRHGHISTLHIWWARRPLAACRAVICASLWPDPADKLCPDDFRIKARNLMTKWAKDHFTLMSDESSRRFIAISKDDHKLDDHVELRKALLDFIADFANWDNSTVKEYLETSRALTQSAHEALGGQSGTKPMVVDSFAGGGSIPLEALRVGADAFASDLNPVAVLLNKVVLEYIPQYGSRLSQEIQKWGKWINKEAEKELAEFYPKDPNDATPIAYLWARTIKCEGPRCGAEVPLIRSLWLAKKSKGSVSLGLITIPDEKKVGFEIRKNEKPSKVGTGTVAKGSATCPFCGFTTPVSSVREQMNARKGGAADAILVAIRQDDPKTGKREYRLPSEKDIQAVFKASDELLKRKRFHDGVLSLVPNEMLPPIGTLGFRVQRYGIEQWENLFTPRQLLSLSTLAKLIRQAGKIMTKELESGLAAAVKTCLAQALNRLADFNSSLCVLNAVGGRGVVHTFGRQALPMVWDFMETNPFNSAGANWISGVDAFISTIKTEQYNKTVGQVEIASAIAHPLPDDSIEYFFTDPPYYDSVPYADLSDFFIPWLRRTVGDLYGNMFREELSPKDDECIVDKIKGKDKAFFEHSMTQAMLEGRRILAPSGLGTIVFAHKSTSGWEAQLKSMIDAGWVVTASWPIDTERPGRLRAQKSAALASSIHLVCRPRENPNGSLRTEDIGDWRDVLQDLPKRIHDWMPRLAKEGVVGADAIFACLGPALEIFSRYSRVEKANGDPVPLREYLEHVWAAVAREALNMIFEGADATGFEEDARLTAMWLWTISTGGNGNGIRNGDEEVRASTGYILEYDAARKIAQGLGAHLEQLGNLVEIKGDKAILLPVSERNRYLFGKESTQEPKGKRKKKDKQMKLSFEKEIEEAEEQHKWDTKSAPLSGKTVLDRIHQCMILFASGRGEALKRFLVEEGIGRDQRFWRLAQSLSALYPANVDEKRWVDGVLSRKKSLGF
jgi:putative DNA methylase